MIMGVNSWRTIRTNGKSIVAPESVGRRIELHDDTDVDCVFRVENQLRPDLALLSPNSGNRLPIAKISLARDLGRVECELETGHCICLACEIGKDAKRSVRNRKCFIALLPGCSSLRSGCKAQTRTDETAPLHLDRLQLQDLCR